MEKRHSNNITYRKETSYHGRGNVLEYFHNTGQMEQRHRNNITYRKETSYLGRVNILEGDDEDGYWKEATIVIIHIYSQSNLNYF